MITEKTIRDEIRWAYTNGLADAFHQASARYGVPLTLLIAVASQESGMGMNLPATGRGDDGRSFGVMQINTRWHNPSTGFNPRSAFDHAHIIEYGAKYLRALYERTHDWRKALASYNAGPDCQSDACTTKRRYVSDVMKRKAILDHIAGASSSVPVPDVTYGPPIDVPLPPRPGQQTPSVHAATSYHPLLLFFVGASLLMLYLEHSD